MCNERVFGLVDLCRSANLIGRGYEFETMIYNNQYFCLFGATCCIGKKFDLIFSQD